MVEFVFRRHGISASGHALFAPYGQDIVCAALSAVFLSGIMCFPENIIDVTKDSETWVFEIKQTALSGENLTMLKMMKKQIGIIAKFYPQYVKIIKED